MSRRPMPEDSARLIRDLRERGFCVLEEAWSPEEGRRLRSLFHGLLEDVLDRGLNSPFAGFGCKVFDLRHREPAVRDYFEAPAIRGFLEQAMEDRVTFKNSGVRWSNGASDARVIWHDHFGWEPEILLRRCRFERMAFNCYLEGSGREMGPLIVSPRAFGDPLHAPSADPLAPRPEEVEVEVPALSIVFMDSALYHCAGRGASAELRTVWGGQAQARSCARAHPEDTDGGWSALRAWTTRLGRRVRTPVRRALSRR